MAINSLEWTEEPLRALNEIKRVLKKDGYACIAILDRQQSHERTVILACMEKTLFVIR